MPFRRGVTQSPLAAISRDDLGVAPFVRLDELAVVQVAEPDDQDRQIARRRPKSASSWGRRWTVFSRRVQARPPAARRAAWTKAASLFEARFEATRMRAQACG